MRKYFCLCNLFMTPESFLENENAKVVKLSFFITVIFLFCKKIVLQIFHFEFLGLLRFLDKKMFCSKFDDKFCACISR